MLRTIQGTSGPSVASTTHSSEPLSDREILSILVETHCLMIPIKERNEERRLQPSALVSPDTTFTIFKKNLGILEALLQRGGRICESTVICLRPILIQMGEIELANRLKSTSGMIVSVN